MEQPGPTIFHRVFGKAVFQFLAAFTASLNLLNSGMHFGWLSPSLPKLLSADSEIQLTSNEVSLLGSGLMLGLVIGAILAALSLDFLGRKVVILLAALPFFIAWMCIAFAQSFTTLFIGRIFAGMGDGITFCSGSLYIGEIAEPKFRGLLGSSGSVLWISGMCLMNAVGSYFSIKSVALTCSSTCIMLWLTFVWMPDSPYYLVMKNNTKKAAKSLRIFKGSTDIESDLIRITKFIEEQRLSTGKFTKIFTEQCNRKSLFIVLVFRLLQQSTGLSSIIFYSQILFAKGGDYISPHTSSVIYFAIYLIFNIICSLIVDKTGRKPLLILSSIGTCATLFMISCYFYAHNVSQMESSSGSIIPFVGLLVHAAAYSLGLQGIPMVIIGELFATSIKPVAVCISHICFAAASVVVLHSFQHLTEHFGMHIPFITYSVFSALTTAFIIFCMPETKGKTLEDIQEELKA